MPVMAKRKPGRQKDPESKRSQGLPRHKDPRFAFHLERELLDALGAFCDAQKLKPDRSEVARLALREFLEREGFWPWPKPSPEPTPAD